MRSGRLLSKLALPAIINSPYLSLLILLLAAACTPGFAVSSTVTPLPVSPLPIQAAAGLQPIPSETQATASASTLPAASGKIVSGTAETIVYVRSGPGTTYDRIGSLPSGVEVQITGKSPHGDWWRVSADGMEGWVFSSFVILEGNAQAVPCVAGAAGDCGAAIVPIDTPTPESDP